MGADYDPAWPIPLATRSAASSTAIVLRLDDSLTGESTLTWHRHPADNAAINAGEVSSSSRAAGKTHGLQDPCTVGGAALTIPNGVGTSR